MQKGAVLGFGWGSAGVYRAALPALPAPFLHDGDGGRYLGTSGIICIGTPEEAARSGEAVIVATRYGTWPHLGRTLGAILAGRLVVDVTNPYPERDGATADEALARGSGLATVAWLLGAWMVKAFG